MVQRTGQRVEVESLVATSLATHDEIVRDYLEPHFRDHVEGGALIFEGAILILRRHDSADEAASGGAACIAAASQPPHSAVIAVRVTRTTPARQCMYVDGETEFCVCVSPDEHPLVVAESAAATKTDDPATVDESAVTQITEMGFGREEAITALEKHRYVVQAAVTSLVSSDSVPSSGFPDSGSMASGAASASGHGAVASTNKRPDESALLAIYLAAPDVALASERCMLHLALRANAPASLLEAILANEPTSISVETESGETCLDVAVGAGASAQVLRELRDTALATGLDPSRFVATSIVAAMATGSSVTLKGKFAAGASDATVAAWCASGVVRRTTSSSDTRQLGVGERVLWKSSSRAGPSNGTWIGSKIMVGSSGNCGKQLLLADGSTSGTVDVDHGYGEELCRILQPEVLFQRTVVMEEDEMLTLIRRYPKASRWRGHDGADPPLLERALRQGGGVSLSHTAVLAVLNASACHSQQELYVRTLGRVHQGRFDCPMSRVVNSRYNMRLVLAFLPERQLTFASQPTALLVALNSVNQTNPRLLELSDIISVLLDIDPSSALVKDASGKTPLDIARANNVTGSGLASIIEASFPTRSRDLTAEYATSLLPPLRDGVSPYPPPNFDQPFPGQHLE